MRKTTFLLILILCVSAVARLVHLGRLPVWFIPEEVSTGWNAFSLLTTGRDEWNTFLPIIFRETGGFKLALNSYLIVPFMAIFGVNELAVRLPTAIAGIISVGLTYFLAKTLWKKESYALVAALLLAISPWHVSMGRYAVDVNWGIPLFLSGLLLFLHARPKPRLLLLSAIFFALTFYTYFNYVVFSVMFMVFTFLVYRKDWLTREKWKWVAAFWGIQFLFMLPYIIQPNLTTRFSQATSVSQIGFINNINEHRESCERLYPPVVCKLMYNKATDRGLVLFRNWINHFSTTTYFLYGSNLGQSGMPQGWGLFYPFELIFIAIGVVVLIRRKDMSPLLLGWGLLYGVPSSLAGEGHVWRMLTLVPLPQLVGAVGLVTVWRFLKFNWARFGLVVMMSFFVARFVVDYTTFFPHRQGIQGYYGFREVYAYTAPLAADYDMVVVSPSGLGFEQLYIYYVFYTQYDPRSYQLGEDVVRTVGRENWVQVSQVGKWRFASDIRNITTELPEKTLFITDGSWQEKQGRLGIDFTETVLHIIPYLNGDPAFKVIEVERI